MLTFPSIRADFCAAIAVVSWGLGSIVTPTAYAGVTLDVHALTGAVAPGADAGVVYSHFGVPVLNDLGQIAFTGKLTGSGVTSSNDSGIWSEGSDSLLLIARTGNTAPGVDSDVMYSGISGFAINGAGQTAFIASLVGPGVNDTNNGGVWSEGGGTLALVARHGDPISGADADVVYSGYGNLVFNDAGQTAFKGYRYDRDADTDAYDILSAGGGALALVAKTGGEAPGTGAGIEYSGFSYMGIDYTGQIAFMGSLSGAGVDLNNNRGIWFASGGSLALYVREGDVIPGTSNNEVYGSIEHPSINGAGEMVFVSVITGIGVSPSVDNSIWSTSGGLLAMVAREGDAAPGTAAGVVFGDLQLSHPTINSEGQTAFGGYIRGPDVTTENDWGIWSEGNGSLSLVVREGNKAPGLGDDVVFERLSHDPVFNGAGYTVFFGSLAGTGVDSSNNLSLWAADPSGRLILIVREGDPIDVDVDPLIHDMRIVKEIDISNSSRSDGGGKSFNDVGQLAFRLVFTDDSEGVFMAMIPEPTCLSLLGSGCIVMIHRRRMSVSLTREQVPLYQTMP